MLSGIDLRPIHELHVDRNLDFQNIDPIALLAELFHAIKDDLRLLLCVIQALLVCTFLISNKLEEKWDVIGPALIANALHPGMLLVIDVLGIVRRVIEQNFHAIRARLFQPPGRPKIEQIRQAAWTGLVVPGFFIRQ